MSNPTDQDVRPADADDPTPASGLQAFGAVVILDGAFRVAYASESCETILGITAEALIDEPLAVLLEDDDVDDLRAALDESLLAVGWRRVILRGGRDRMKLHAFAAGDGLTGLDIMPLPSEPPGTDAQAVERVAGWTQRLFACESTEELFDTAVRLTRERTRYQGAWLTQVHDDGSAVIVASDQPGRSNVVGQRVPASDLPPGQPMIDGRYVPFCIADLRAAPSALRPAPAAVDLQGSALHRPFPVYLEQLAKIGVGALASIPIVIDGRIWGRISSASATPARLSAATQAELGLIGAAVATRLSELFEHEAAEERVGLSRSAARVVRALAATNDLMEGLTRDEGALCGVCAAEAAIVAIGDDVATVGVPLGDEVIAQLRAAASEALAGASESTVSTEAIADPVDPARAAGYVAVRLSPDSRDMVIWVGGEERRSIEWLEQRPSDGAPPESLSDGVEVRREEQRGRCAPWTDGQLQQAEELREAIGEVVVARYGQMQTLADELMRSNEEYDAFAHAAAHDLKTPLRGMRLTTEFLLEDLDGRLSDAELEEFATVLRLADRMNTLLDDLLAYARVGRKQWRPEPVHLPSAVDEAVELLGPLAAHATITADDATYVADPGALRQLLTNLIGNAAKYSPDEPTISVTVTTLEDAARQSAVPESLAAARPRTPVLAVSDRGMGIEPAHHERIFGLFHQLDPSSTGSGTGLALCRLISRRHGGDIWVHSEPGEGATFFVATGRDG